MKILNKSINKYESIFLTLFLVSGLLSFFSYVVSIYAIRSHIQFNFLLLSNILLIVFLLSGLLLTFRLTTLLLSHYENHISQFYPVASLIFLVLNKIIKIAFILIGIYTFVSFLPISIVDKEILGKIVNGILILLSGWFILQVFSIIENWYSKQYIKKKRDVNSQLTRIKILRQLLNFIVIIITISSILMLFNNVRTLGISLLASAGFITAILGFAAQKPLSAIFTNFNLAFSQPIKIGDIVIIQQEFGRIEEITMNFVVVKLWDSRQMVVPSSYFIDNPFQNWTYQKTNLLGTIFLYVDYTFPVRKLRDKLNQFLQSTDLWDQQVSNIQVTDFKEDCVELRILISATSPEKLWDLRVLIREKCLYFMNKKYPNCFPKQRIVKENESNETN